MCDIDAPRYAVDQTLNGGLNGTPAPPRPVFYGATGCSGKLMNIQQNVLYASSQKPTSAFLPAYMVLTETFSSINFSRSFPPNGFKNASGLAVDITNIAPTSSAKYTWSFQAPFDSEIGWMRDMCMGEQYEVERDQPLISSWKPGSKECDAFMIQQCSGPGAANDPACACINAAKGLAQIGPVQCLSRACSSSGYRTKNMLAPCTFTECDQIRNVSGDALIDVTGEVFCGGKIYNLGEGATPDDVPPELLPLRVQPADPKTHSQTLMIILIILIIMMLVIGAAFMMWRRWG